MESLKVTTPKCVYKHDLATYYRYLNIRYVYAILYTEN